MDAHFVVSFQNPKPPPHMCAKGARIRSEMAGGGRRCAYTILVLSYLCHHPVGLGFAVRFVGESYGMRWSVDASDSLTLGCTDHRASSALVPLQSDRAEDMAALQNAILTVQVYSIEERGGGTTFNELHHRWRELGLGEFQPPGVRPATWLWFRGDELEMEVFLPEEAFRRLVDELRAFGMATHPKFFWGDTFDFKLDRETELRDASKEHTEAFFKSGLPLMARRPPSLSFVVGAAKETLDLFPLP